MSIVRNAVAAALLWASVLASHYLAYFLAFPDPAERSHELSHSGHGWLSDVTHFGLPLFVAIIAVGLIAGPVANSKIRSRGLAFSSAMAFAGIEISERAINSLTTSHPFILSFETLAIGTAFAALFGYLISSLFYEVQIFVLSKFGHGQIAAFVDVELNTANKYNEVQTKATQEFLRYSIKHRGPPAVLNSN